MEAVKRGADRQELHERIRVHSMDAAKRVKEEGLNNDLLERIIADPNFKMTREEILQIVNPIKFVGRAPGQARFLRRCCKPILKDNENT